MHFVYFVRRFRSPSGRRVTIIFRRSYKSAFKLDLEQLAGLLFVLNVFVVSWEGSSDA
jgi:hypothetical protein